MVPFPRDINVKGRWNYWCKFVEGGNGKLSYQYYLIYLHIFCYVEWCIYFFGARAKLNKTARNTAQNKCSL